MSFLGFWAFMVLMVLKLTEVIDISWLAASAPFWGAILFDIVVLTIWFSLIVHAERKW